MTETEESMLDSASAALDGGSYRSSALTRGPWHPGHPHAGPPIAQVCRATGLSGAICAVVVAIASVLATTRVDAQPTATLPPVPDTAPIAQQPTAERPVWMVGYKWTFHRVGGTPQVESKWSREVTQSLPEEKFAVLTETGKELLFDGETNSLDRRGPDYSWKRFSFPLFVGKQWTHKRRFGDAGYDGYETSSWEVKGYEKITVPAGTYDCFRVEGVVWGTLAIPPYGPLTSHQAFTYWYCPAIKWAARFKEHRQANQYANYVDATSELTAFSVGH